MSSRKPVRTVAEPPTQPPERLEDLSDVDLMERITLHTREAEAARQEANRRMEVRRQQTADAIVKNVDALLEVAAWHGSLQCSDRNLSPYSHCVRCRLLACKRDGYWDASDAELHITIHEPTKE